MAGWNWEVHTLPYKFLQVLSLFLVITLALCVLWSHINILTTLHYSITAKKIYETMCVAVNCALKHHCLPKPKPDSVSAAHMYGGQ